ncbi:GNAT family N-acetyltransferase [Actinoplanes sp. TBRC 11911]|uniref:GNAT family N-acetyltransferase n=1 Tax=Actinoplanes sp. TBRC 11911 TaxID=2729386 RepID=UPI00145CBBB3|nr:GNAT family N-acetyltransferase [Actinoplanes sp. TBRC 11911]NMO57228.1 GNAT family N-acetyltransferase [Actinoplanes sp. TBRC 11911]
MRIESRPALDPELAALVAAQQREVRAFDPALTTALFAPTGDVAYLVAVVDERAVACGAWQPVADGVAELRRMYVRPAFRNRGIARQMIVAIEEEALAADRPVIRLETGSYLPAAIALYQSSGYHQIPVYGEYVGNPYSVCFEKRLAALVQ